MDNIEHVYFRNPVHVRTRSTTKPIHAASSDRHQLALKGAWLTITVDGYVTMVPVENITSISLLKGE